MATTLTAADELERAVGQISETVTVKAKGKPTEVTVTPFRLRQFAHVMRCFQRMRDAGVIEANSLSALKDASSAEEASKGFDVLKMFLEGGDEIINILQTAVGNQLPAQVLNELDLLDGARLASAVFAVNVDFFYLNREAIQAALAPAVRAVTGVMENGLETLGQPPQGALGQPLQTDSSEPDTP